jgi:hypothetical protein
MLACAACGGKQVATGSLPSDPTAAVEQFLAGVDANDVRAMSRVWGSSKGPAANWMDADEMQKRLSVVRSYLVHESYVIEPGEPVRGIKSGERTIRVQLTRLGCRPVVPFTVLRVGDGWLVSAIDLEAAGNPARQCS